MGRIRWSDGKLQVFSLLSTTGTGHSKFHFGNRLSSLIGIDTRFFLMAGVSSCRGPVPTIAGAKSFRPEQGVTTMPKRSDILRYKEGDCFEVILDINDAMDSTFDSATFTRGTGSIEWPVIETETGRAEFRSNGLLAVHLIASPPKGQKDNPSLALKEIEGKLEVKLKYRDPTSGKPTSSTTTLTVIPCSISACDSCEAQERANRETARIGDGKGKYE
jgi:hypothetical protein